MTTANKTDDVDEGSSEGLTAQLIDLARSVNVADLPDRVQTSPRRHSFLDSLGVMLLGSSAKPVDTLRHVLLQPGSDGPVTTMVKGFSRTGAVDGALINGTAAHTMDYDDSGAGGHISNALVPGALAIAEMQESSGREFLSAVIAGYETSRRLSSLLSESCYGRGFHGSALVAPFAVTVAGCHLLGLSRRQWDMAIGVTGSLSSGLRSNFGTMTKGLHAGHAASNGVLACLLAADDFTGATGVLEGYMGFLKAHTADPVEEMEIRPLGEPYALDHMVYKANAACGSTQSPANGMRALIFEAGIPVSQIAKAVILVSAVSLEHDQIVQRPQTIFEIKFSPRFMAAAGALGYNTGDEFFKEDLSTSDPALNEMMDKIVVDQLPGLLHGGETDIEVTLTDGSSRHLRLNSMVPNMELDEEWKMVSEKFKRAASTMLGNRVEEVVSRVERLEEEQSMQSMVRDVICGANSCTKSPFEAVCVAARAE